MSRVQINPIYSAACASRHENNIISLNNHLVFSRSRCPVIHKLSAKRAANTFLLGHHDEVNGLSLVKTETQTIDEINLISTSHDNTAIIWSINLAANPSYRVAQKLISPDNTTFTSRCSLRKSDYFISVTSNLDGQLYLWRDSELVQTVQVKYYSFHAHIHSIPLNSCTVDLLFLAGSDNKVHVLQINSDKLEPLFDLKGHYDWIKCLDTHTFDNQSLDFLLASASQDSYIRVWYMRIIEDRLLNSNQVRTVSSKYLTTPSSSSFYRLTATLETVLSGHENIVHGLCWFKRLDKQQLQLVSCSADKTIVLWRSQLVNQGAVEKTELEHQFNSYNQSSVSNEVWTEQARIGETGETNLPFLGVCLSSNENTIFAHSLRGAIHSWIFDGNSWSPGRSISGHFEPVTDLSWELSSGAYLLSSSLDKTIRLHTLTCEHGWSEVGRPQVHGHEINCVSSLKFNRFVSGSEEKTIRAFEATKFFMKSLLNFSLIQEAIPKGLVTEMRDISENSPLHAQLPALGLSNKAAKSPYDLDGPIDEKSGQSNNWYSVSNLVKQLAQTERLETIPTEEILLQSTLWWESGKLFGHSNEIHTIACSSTGAYLASASRANRLDLARIFLWETSKLRKVGSIEYHSLTITRLRFSHDSRYLLSVSRDRTWALYEHQTGQLRNPYKLKLGTNKNNALHERIIWDCTWTFDSKYFLTVSRDKKAIVWSADTLTSEHLGDTMGDQQNEVAINEIISKSAMIVKTFESSIQAVDSPNYRTRCDQEDQIYVIAFGFESGLVELHRLQVEGFHMSVFSRLENLHSGLPIRRLAFRPSTKHNDCDNDNDNQLLLASAGDDCVVRLTAITGLISEE